MLVAWDKNGTMGVIRVIDYNQLLQKGVVLTLRPSRTLKIAVKNPSGNPLQGAQISFHRPWTVYEVKRTGKNGEVVFSHIFQGRATSVNVRFGDARNHKYVTIPDPVAKDWKDTIEVVLDAANRVQKGTVVDPDDNPVAGAEINTASGSSTMTNVKGEFELQNMSDSKDYIFVKTTWGSGSAPVSKDSGDVTIKLRYLK